MVHYQRAAELQLQVTRYNLLQMSHTVECSGSGVELRTLDYENPGSNPVLRC